MDPDRRLDALVLAHAGATLAMVGVIWVVQAVHYPMFADVGTAAYPAYQEEHIDRIGALLVVPWGLEGLTLVALVLLAPPGRLRTGAVVGAGLMGAILLVTAVWAAPAHGELTDGFDPAVHDRLMASNLVRTLLWTARGGVALLLVWWRLGRRSGAPTPPVAVTV